MKSLALASLSLFLAVVACADELVKSAQTELKNAGFYYGNITGINSPETTSAVKRYQIRNGLEVTGTLTKETLDALGLGGNASPAPSATAPPLTLPERKAQPVEPAPRTGANTPPPINLRRTPTDQDSDREYLKRAPSQSAGPGLQPNLQPFNAPPSAQPGGSYGRLFARTPYASAPLEVQQSTVQKAQKFMQSAGFFREPIDGQPSPATEEAILSFQRSIRLPLTGQFDLETLAAMRLLPGRGGAPMRPAGNGPDNRPIRTLRGVWVR